jgi:hypothetical protein
MSKDSKHLTHTILGTLAPEEWKKFTSNHLTYTIHSTFPPEEWKRFTSTLTGPAICRLAHALFRDSRTDGPLDESTAAAELRDAA